MIESFQNITYLWLKMFHFPCIGYANRLELMDSFQISEVGKGKKRLMNSKYKQSTNVPTFLRAENKFCIEI